MFAALAAFVMAQFSTSTPEPVRIEGRCTYPDELVARAEGTATWLVPCGEATLDAEGITFAARGFSPSIRFLGTWDGRELELSHVARRGQDEAEEARGFCRLEFREAEISAIVCTAIASPRSYVVNFIVPNI